MNKTYKLIRSQRKTVALQIKKEDASLVIRAPKKLSLDYIEELIKRKQNWIEKKQKEILTRSSQKMTKEFLDNEEFLFMGEKYQLKFVEEQRQDIILADNFLVKKDSEANIKDIFESWYKKMALKKITQKVEFLSQKHGLKYRKIKLSNASSYWGLCNHRNDLLFSWRIVMAPEGVIDYLVAHEMAHLKHKNHSGKFWQQVEEIFPKYKQEKKWLKEKGYLLKI